MGQPARAMHHRPKVRRPKGRRKFSRAAKIFRTAKTSVTEAKPISVRVVKAAQSTPVKKRTPARQSPRRKNIITSDLSLLRLPRVARRAKWGARRAKQSRRLAHQSAVIAGRYARKFAAYQSSELSQKAKALICLMLVFILTFSPVLPSFDPFRLFGALTSEAAVLTWDGGGADNSWSTKENWSEDRLPTADDLVTFTELSRKDVIIDVDVSVAGFDITESYPSIIELRSGKRITVGSEGFTQENGTFIAAGVPMEINGSFNLRGGKFVAPTAELLVKDTFQVSQGTFEHNNGSVILNGLEQLVFGAITFFNLTKTTDLAAALEFESGSTITVEGTLQLIGANHPSLRGTEGNEVTSFSDGSRLNIRSTRSGEPFMLDTRGAVQAQYLNLRDILNIGSQAIICDPGCVDSGNVNGFTTPSSQPTSSQGGVLQRIGNAVRNVIPNLSSEEEDVSQDSNSNNEDPQTLTKRKLTNVRERATSDFAGDEPVVFTVSLTQDSNKVEVKPAQADVIVEEGIPTPASATAGQGGTTPVEENRSLLDSFKFLNFNYISSPLALTSNAAFKIAHTAYLAARPSTAHAQEGQLEVVKAAVTDPSGTLVANIQPQATVVEGQLAVHVPKPEEQTFRPGKYTLSLEIKTADGQTVTSEQDFTWGVLAVNFPSSTYEVGQEVQIGMAVLDDKGHTLCDAALQVVVTRNSEPVTGNVDVTKSETCGPITVTNEPDYKTSFTPDAEGEYTVTVTANTKNGTRSMERKILVARNQPFVATRKAPTRIYPPANYTVQVEITATEDFVGSITEPVPAHFEILNISHKGRVEAINTPPSHNLEEQAVLDGVGGPEEAVEDVTPEDETLAQVVVSPTPTPEVTSNPETVTSNNESTSDELLVTSPEDNEPLTQSGGTDVTTSGVVTGLPSPSATPEPLLTVETAPSVEPSPTVEVDPSATPSETPTPSVGDEVPATSHEGENSSSLAPRGSSLKAQYVVWENVSLNAGDTLTLQYTFKAPPISPEFYLLGPLGVTRNQQPVTSNDGTSYELRVTSYDWAEPNAWQIAADAVIVWDGGGTTNNWSEDANWVGDIEPSTGDVATFDGTSTKNATIDASINVAGIDINTGYTGTITQAGSVTVTVGLSNYDQAAGTFTGSDSAIISSGDFILSGGTFTSTSGTLTIGGNGTVSTDGTGDFTQTGGTFTHNSGAVKWAGINNTWNLSSSLTLNNFEIDCLDNGAPCTSGSTMVLASGDTIVVGGTFTHTDGAVFTGTIEVQGNMVAGAGGDFGSVILSFLVAGDQTITSSGANTGQLNINKPSGTISVGSANLGIYNLTLVSGTFTSTSGVLTIGTGNNSSGNLTQTGGTFNHNNGTVKWGGGGNTWDIPTSLTLNNLEVDCWVDEANCGFGGASAMSIATGDTIIVEGTFTHTDGSTFGGTIEVRGNVLVGSGGDYSATNISFLVAGDQTITSSGGSMGILNINKPSGIVSAGSANLGIYGLTLASGTFTSTSAVLTLGRNSGNSGNLTHTGGTFNHNNGSVRWLSSLNTWDVATSMTFNNLEIDCWDSSVNCGAGASVIMTVASGDTIIVEGNLTFLDGVLNGGTFQVQGNVTIGSSASGGSAALQFTGTNNQLYTDSGDVINSDVTINKASGTVTLASNANWNSGGQDTTITEGTLSLAGFTLATNVLTLEDGATMQLQGGETVTATTKTVNTGATVVYIGNGTGAATTHTVTNHFTQVHHLTINDTSASNADTFQLGAALDANGNFSLTDGTFDQAAQTMNVAGNFTITDGATFTKSSNSSILRLDGDLTLTDNSATKQDLGVLHIGASPDTTDLASDITASSLTINGGDILNTNGYDLDINGSITIASTGTFDATDDIETDTTVINVSGNWSNSGTFTASDSDVIFDGTSQTISGSTTFFDFSKVESSNDSTDAVLTFEAGATQTITGTWTLDGLDNNDRINLRSTAASQWSVDPQGTRTLDYLDVQYSNNINALAIILCQSIDSGNNTNWELSGVCEITGTVYTDEGSTNIGANKTVRVAIEGADHATTDETDASGVYNITDLNVTSGDVLTVYLEDEPENAVTVTVSDGVNLTGMNLYQDRLIVRHDDAGAISNANLLTGLVSSEDDVTSLYALSSGNLTINNTYKLFIPSGHTFAPGGNVTVNTSGTAGEMDVRGTFTQNTHTLTVNGEYQQSSGTFSGGSGSINMNGAVTLSGGTFTSTSGTLTIARDYTNSGATFNHNSGTTLFSGPPTATQAIDVNTSETFNTLTLRGNGGGGTHVAIGSGDTLVALGTLTLGDSGTHLFIDTGTIEPRANVTVGSWPNSGTGTISFLTTGDQTITSSGGGNRTLPNLNINKSSGTVSVTGTLQVSSFTLSSGTFTSTSETLTVNENWTHTAGGTFNHNSGTVVLDNGNNNSLDVSTSETFNHLTISKDQGNTTFGLNGDTLIILGTFTHSKGTINSGTLEVRGDVAISSTASTLSGGTATMSFTGTNNQTYTDSGGDEINGDITINKSSGTVTLASNADWNATSQDVTITEGILYVAGNTLATNTLTIEDGGVLQLRGDDTITETTTTQNTGSQVVYSGDTDGTADSYTINQFTSFENLTINDGLVGYWKLDESANDTCSGGEDACDSSGYGNHGTATGSSGTNTSGPAISSTVPTLNYTNPNSRDFDGTDDELSVGNPDILKLNNASGMSISAWAKFDAVNDFSGIISKGNSFDDELNFDYHLGMASSGLVQFRVSDGSPSDLTVVDSSALTSTSTWYHILATWDGSTVSNGGKLYINGALRAQGTAPFPQSEMTTTHNVYIGGHDNNLGMNGGIDDVRIYNRALSAEEIARLAAGNQPQTGVDTFTLASNIDVNADLSINTGTLNTDSTNNYSITVGSDWLNHGGLFTPNSGTVTLDAASGTGQILSGSQTFNHVTLNDNAGSATFELQDNADINGNLTITGGTLDASTSNRNINLAGNWSNSDTFTARNGTVTFDGTNQTLSGATTFYNFTKVEGGNNETDETLTFPASTTTTVSGTLTLTGTDQTDRINLVSSSPATAWNISVATPGTESVNFVDIADSNNTSSGNLTACQSVDSGGNTAWDIYTTCAASGTVYSDEGTTAIGANKTVRAAVNGVDVSTAETAANGTYTISDITAVSNDVLTFYLEDEPENAVNITVTDGINLTGFDLYQDRLITRHDNGGSITNANLLTGIVSSEADITDVFNVASSNLTMTDSNDGLAGYWKFDDGTGTTAADSSGNGYTGTLTNMETTDWTTSVSSGFDFTNPYALDFDGTNEYVTTSDAANLEATDTADLTFSVWFNRDTATTDDTILAKRNSDSAADAGYLLYIDDADDKIYFEISDGTDEYQLASTSTITATGWNHVIVVWDQDDASATRIYLNGVNDNATATGTIGNIGDASNAVSFAMAAESDAGNPFDGKLDDVRIYDRALSPNEISSLAAGNYTHKSELFIPTSHTFTPGGTIDVGDIDINGTLTLGSNNAQVSGTWDATGGTFTTTGQTMFTGTGTESDTITSNSNSFQNVVINDGLVGYWKFDESANDTCSGGQDACDSSGYGNHGTATGASGTNTSGPAITSTVPTLNYTNPNSRDFDGTDDTVSIANNPLTDPSQITISLWINPVSLDRAIGHRAEGLVRADDGSTSELSLHLNGETSNEIEFWVRNTTGTMYTHLRTGTLADFTAGNWYHIVATANGVKSGKIYLNGVQRSGVSTDIGIGSAAIMNTDWKIGDSELNNRFFEGKLDDVRIYNRALSAEEIARMAAGNQPETSSATYTLEDSLDVNGDLTLNAGTLDTNSGENNAIDVASSWLNNGGKFTANSNTVTLSSTATGKTLLSGGQKFNNLTVSGSGGGWTLGDRLPVTGAITHSNGTIDTNSTHSWGIDAGNLSQTAGTLTTNSSRVMVDSTTTYTLQATSSLYDLHIGDPLRRGLVGWWKMDEGTDNTCSGGQDVCDSSSSGLHGTIQNGDSDEWTTSSAPTYNNPYAMDFDGTNDYVSVNSTDVGTTHTAAAWVWRESAPATPHILGSNDHSTILKLHSGTTLGYRNATTDYNFGSALSTGRWYHIAITRTGTTITGYINGVSQGSQTLDSNASVLFNKIGARHTTAFFDGRIDDARVYNRELSAAEIAELAGGDYQPLTTGTTATYTLGNNLDVNNDLQLNDGILAASSYNITLAGDWNNETGSGSAFTAGTGLVTFDGADQAINGDNSFNNFTKADDVSDSTDETLTFEASATQIIAGTWTLTGQNTNDRVNLRSSAEDTQWEIDPQGTRNLTFIDVQDSNNINETPIVMCEGDAINSGNNTNWSIGLQLTQNDWRWYVDNDSEDVTDPWGNPNLDENELMSVIPATNDPAQKSDELRARLNIEADCSIVADTIVLKLQYTESSSCSDEGNVWTDVGASGSGSIWRYASSSVADGTELTVAKLSTTDVLQTYVKTSSSSTNPNAINTNELAEWDFHIEHNGADTASQYCFRAVETDGTALNGYNADSFPRLETKPGPGDVLRHGNVFINGTERGYSWAD